MVRKVLTVVAAGLACAAVTGEAKAQFDVPMPDWGMNRMMGNVVAANQMGDQYAWYLACQAAAALPPGARVQFNNSAFQQSMGQYQQAANGFLAAGRRHGDVAIECSNRFIREGIQGQGIFVNPQTGHQIEAPWAGGPFYTVPQTLTGSNLPGWQIAVPGIHNFGPTYVPMD